MVQTAPASQFSPARSYFVDRRRVTLNCLIPEEMFRPNKTDLMLDPDAESTPLEYPLCNFNNFNDFNDFNYSQGNCQMDRDLF